MSIDIKTQERHSARVIYSTISYIVQRIKHGTDGAVVLLHDIPCGAFVWQHVMPLLAATNRAIYAVDMLSYGHSDHLWPADTSIWGHADALSMLFSRLNLTNVILVGHGLGGGVAQILAMRLSAERIAALVLIDTICYERSFAENWPLPNMQKCQHPEIPKQTPLEEMIHALSETLLHGVHDHRKFQRHIDDYIAPWNSELGKEILFQHIRNMIPYYCNSVASDLKNLTKPTLIIWGQDDQQMPLKWAQRLHHDIPESHLTVIPHAGHLVLFDAPTEVAHALVDFVITL